MAWGRPSVKTVAVFLFREKTVNLKAVAPMQTDLLFYKKMRVYKVFVGDKDGTDSRVEREIRNFGIDSVSSVKKFTVFWLTNIGRKDIEKLLNILHNPILQTAYISKLPGKINKGKRLVEVVSNL